MRATALLVSRKMMELPFASFEEMEVCSTIHIGMVEGKTAKKKYADILRLYDNCMTIQWVRNWRRDFSAGRTSLVDKPRSGGLSDNVLN